MLLYFFISAVYSQDQQVYCEDETTNVIVNQCLTDVALLKSTTCGYPAVAENATMTAQCNCYFDVNEGNCYKNCPNDLGVQNATAANLAKTTQECAAVNLNPARLPQPPPWQKYFATSSTKPGVAPTSPPVNSPLPPTNENKNDAFMDKRQSLSFLAIIATVLLI